MRFLRTSPEVRPSCRGCVGYTSLIGQAIKVTGTSITRDVVVSKPSVTFADIGGLQDVKNELREMITMP